MVSWRILECKHGFKWRVPFNAKLWIHPIEKSHLKAFYLSKFVDESTNLICTFDLICTLSSNSLNVGYCTNLYSIKPGSGRIHNILIVIVFNLSLLILNILRNCLLLAAPRIFLEEIMNWHYLNIGQPVEDDVLKKYEFSSQLILIIFNIFQ